MKNKLPIDELLRLACIYAERDQMEYLNAVHADPEEVAETREYLRQLRAYRLKRWGKTRLEGWIDSAVEITVQDYLKSATEAT